MKKIKRSLILSLVLLFIPIIVIGCSSKPKVSADETAKILFDFYVKGDQQSLSKIKISKEETEGIAKVQKNQTKFAIKNKFTLAGLIIDDEQVNKIYEARIAALKKLSAKAEVISEDDESVRVKLKTTYIDESSIDKKAGTDAVAEVKKMNVTNRQEAINKATEIYIKNIIKGYESSKPSSDMKEDTFKFTIKEKIWMPYDMTNFGTSIGKLIIGIK